MTTKVSWKCQKCGTRNFLAYATNKRSVTCKECSAVYAITGLHTNGTPFLRYMAKTSKLDRR